MSKEQNLKNGSIFRPKTILAWFSLLTVIFLPTAEAVTTKTETDSAMVTAEVFGTKPLVYNFTPLTGQNNGATAITAIVGRNLTGALVVTLDDPNSTALTGAITVVDNTDNDPNVAGVGGGGTYQKITGLSVPAGITPGIYNILVTTANGTNTASDVKFTVTAPPPSPNAQITSVSPGNPIFVALGGSADVTFDVSDTDSATVYYHITENGGTWNGGNTGTVALAGGAGSKTTTFDAGLISDFYSNTLKVDDDNGVLPGTFDDSIAITFLVLP